MTNQDPTLPPLALALGRLRQPRPAPRAAWPFALPTEKTPLDGITTTSPAHDFLRMLPEPALSGELPPPRPTLVTPQNRPYWFDL